MTGRRGRGRGRGGKVAILQRRLATLHNSIKGKPLKIPADPPSFTQVPWNSIILSDPIKLKENEVKKYAPADLYEMLKAQAYGPIFKEDITAPVTKFGKYISFRIQAIKCWNLSGFNINLQVLDLSTALGADDLMVQLEDQPGRNKWARVGYSYPSSQSILGLSGHDTEHFCYISSGKASDVVTHFHVLWKCRTITLPNRSVSQFRRLCLD